MKIIDKILKMSKVISILHDKGGVAKTTTSMNLGTALWLMGKKVLMIDADKQCNLTMILDRTAISEHPDGTLYEWMRREQDTPPIYTRYEGLDFIPSCRQMAGLENELVNKKARERILSRLLDSIDVTGEKVRDEYDFIIIDCGPGCDTMVNTNALLASDGIIVPMFPESLSLHGVPTIRQAVKEINEELDGNVEIIGYLLTRYNSTKRLHKDIMRECQNLEIMGGPLLPIKIRECVRCAESVANEMSLFEYESTSTAADDYMRLAEYLCGVTKRNKKFTPESWGKKANEAYEQLLNDRNEA